jgi:DNA-binding SARP family transcriptional activator/tetratricopeptide (TPR) repeat protein
MKIGGPRERAVLAVLALRANRLTTVEQLIDAVWGEDPPSTARGQIQGCISNLRKLFDDASMQAAIETQSNGYQLTVTAAELDSEKFAELIAIAQRQASAGEAADATASLRTALELWRGPALEGIASDYVHRSAMSLADARLTAIEERVRLDLELGRHDEIGNELRALITEYPLRERLYGFLMLALYRSGHQAEALEICRRARVTLIDEVGIDLSPKLQNLERAMLNRDPSLDLPADIGRPPSPNAGSPERPRQLPTTTADFIGREEQIQQVVQILSDAQRSDTARFSVPIIGIFGPGGVGKSTLALRVAHESASAFPDGHLYVDLSGSEGQDRTTLLLARFLRALGVSGSAIPDDPAERAELYRSRLANKRLLVVFDGVSSEEELLPLLPGSPGSAVIVTSRTRLDVLQGAIWVGLDAFAPDTSMELLAKIVGWSRLKDEPEATAELVEYCGGLPLALRIAGARLASRPHWRIAELARRLKNEVQRLDELSYRGLEIRSSIGLSYRSLADQTKRLFRLFALAQAPSLPGWMASVLLDTEVTEGEDILERLVDVQLLDTVPCPGRRTRYRFHDLIRVYAQERLLNTETAAERDQALARMLGAWLALAERAHRAEYGGDYTILHGNAARVQLPEWASEDVTEDPMEWLEYERSALVACVRQAAAAGMDELCWDLALTAVCLFEVKGYFDDWRETAELALEVCLHAGNRTGQAAMLYSLGTLHMYQKHLAEAGQSFTEALALFAADGNVHGQALVLRNAAVVDRLLGNFAGMLAKYEESLVKMRQVGDPIGEATILRSLAKFRMDEGDTAIAETMLSEAMALCQGANYVRGEAQVASRFAELYLSTGQVLLARQTLNRVLASVRETGDRIGEAYTVYWLGVVRRREGSLDTAEATFALALSIAEQVGDLLIEAQAHYALGELSLARTENAKAWSHLARARTLFDELGAPLWLARSLIRLGEADDPVELGDIAAPTVAEIDRVSALLENVPSKDAVQLRGQLAELRSSMALSGTEPTSTSRF